MSIAPTATETHRPPPTIQPPALRPFYGPVIAAGCTIALVASGPGQTVVVSQFNDSFTTSLGLSATSLSGAYLLGTVAAALPLTLVGALADRFGPRRVMLVVALLFGLACAATGRAHDLATLTVCFFLLRLLGQGALGVLSGHVLALWYERRLGTANGVKMVFAQVGFALWPWVAIGLIGWLGWRQAYAALGLLVWLLVLPIAAFVLKDRPAALGQRIDGDGPNAPGTGAGHDPRHVDPAFTLRRALRTRALWILAGATALSGFTGTALLFHAQPILLSRGLDAGYSAAMSMSWALAVALFVLPMGWLSDRVPPRGLLALAGVLMAASPALVVVAGSVFLLCLAMAIYGVAMAIGSAVAVPTIARYFGRRHHGAIRGFTAFLAVAGTGLGPVVLGVGFDQTGSFAAGLLPCAGLALALALASLSLRRPLPPEPPGPWAGA